MLQSPSLGYEVIDSSRVLYLQALNFRMCGVFLVDSSFMVEGSKFISGTMAALSVMVNISIPHVNVLTKMDLLNAESRSQLERWAEAAAM